MRSRLALGGILSLLYGGAANAASAPAPAPAPASSTTQKAGDVADPGYMVRSSTKIDFNEAAIEGRMKAPDGFFLQGRKSQEMQNLLKLRSKFRRELSGSASAAENTPQD